MYELIASVDPETDKAALLANNKLSGVVLFANEAAMVVLRHDTDAPIRDDDGRNAWVIWTYVSTARPNVRACYCTDEEATKGFEWNGALFPFLATEIEDVTPVDQSDLSNPGAIANDPPNQYPTFEAMYERWKNPESPRILAMLDSIRRGEEAVVNDAPNGGTAADKTE